MDRNIFRYILRHSARSQLLILAMTLASFPFLYATLELPKLIVNDALSGKGEHRLYGMQFDQVEYLFLLCGLFLILVLINGGFKYVVNVYEGIVGERMLRRLRYELFSRVLRFPLPHFRHISPGEIVQMINAEVEPLGGFIAEAFALPAFQGGTLLTVLVFIFAQDPVMGLAAVALYPFQIYVIPKLQRQVNLLGKARVRQVRRLADRIAETVGGVRDIRANDTTQYERARFTRELGVVFNIRYQIYKKKFFIKFLNNFMAQLGPFFFYSIGGYLVITGDLTLGALVAVVGAHKELYSPWKELLNHYQLTWDSQIKFEQVVAQFDPAGLRDEALQSADPTEEMPLTGLLRGINLTLTSEDGQLLLDGASFAVELPARIGILGPAGSGKEELTLVLANLLDPDAGRVLINEVELHKLPEAITGRRITHVGYPAQIFSGTIADNLFFGLRHRPVRPRQLEGAAAEKLKRDAGGGALGQPAVRQRGRLDRLRERRPERARGGGAGGGTGADHGAPRSRRLPDGPARHDRSRGPARGRCGGARGAPRDARAARGPEPRPPGRGVRPGALQQQRDARREPAVRRAGRRDLRHRPSRGPSLRPADPRPRPGLTDPLVQVGFKLADTMVELFADLPPDHEYFRQFSFINADDLPDYRALTTRVDPARLDTLGPEDRERLIALTFKLIPARHRLDLIDEALQARVLEARRRFREKLPPELAAASPSSRPIATRPRPASRTTSCSARSRTVRRRRSSGSAI